MIGLNGQLAKNTRWRTIAGASLVLLIAFLINLSGAGEALAHSTVSVQNIQMEHSRSGLLSSANGTNTCHHQYGADKTETPQAAHAHGNRGDVDNQEEHDCNTCCPFETSANSSAYLRSKHAHDWFAVLDYSEKASKPFYVSIGSIIRHNASCAQRYTTQLNGLSEAQVQFLHTVRLLT